MKYTKEQWAVELERRKAWDWSKTDCQLSRDHGVCRPCVQKTRIKLGIYPVVKMRDLKSAPVVGVAIPQSKDTFQLPSGPGIYVWWNSVTNKRYVGQSRCVDKRYFQHLNMLRDGKHPNAHLQAAFALHGEAAFHFLVIQQCGSVDHLNNAERSWINKFISNDRRFGYNFEDGGGVGKSVSQETIRKSSIARIGQKRSDESRRKMSLAKLGKPPTEKQLAQIRRMHEHRRQKRLADIASGKIVLKVKGAQRPPVSDETRLKMRMAKLGKPSPHIGAKRSEESRRKMSLAHAGKPRPWLHGKKASDETRAKMSAGQLRRHRREREERIVVT